MKEAAITPDMLSGLTYTVSELNRLRPVIENALPRTGGTHNFDDLVLSVIQGKVRMWTTEGSFCLVEKVVYPRCTHYHIFLAGGDMDELRGLHPPIIEAARADDATAVTITGRHGWTRALKDWGWVPTYTSLKLELEK